ncbi:MAG: hypothetical protein BRC44_00890, partial [Cyanobacteria bacterium QS_4_48_99]
MSKLNGVKSATAILMTLSMSGGAITPLVAPIVAPAAAVAQTSNFPDVEQSYWAADFISALRAPNKTGIYRGRELWSVPWLSRSCLTSFGPKSN